MEAHDLGKQAAPQSSPSKTWANQLDSVAEAESTAAASSSLDATLVDNTPPNCASTEFTTVKKLFSKIYDTAGDALYVSGVSIQDFERIDEARSQSNRRFRFRRFYAGTGLLIIVIPTLVHEALHRNLDKFVIYEIVSIGLFSDWTSSGAGLYRQRPNGDGGEGDSTGRPCSARPGPGRWPTLVIEAGYSQTLVSLRQDMRWWFSASEHQVKIVLLVKMLATQRKIIVERWQEVHANPRPGAMSTRSASALVPQIQQEISIDRAESSSNPLDHNSYEVTRGALRLGFQDLFLRPPRQGEHDIVISTEKLKEFAGLVWQEFA